MKKNLFLLSLSCGFALDLSAQEMTLEKHWWQTNGSVHALELDVANNLVYLAGDFSVLGPSVNGSVMLDQTTAFPDLTYPQFNGTINIALPDGNGGWFVGGYFATIGDSIRNGLAHINSAKQVTAWNAHFENYTEIRALAIDGNTLYVGGKFTAINGQNRNNIAALDLATGDLETWNVGTMASVAHNRVSTIAVDNNTVYFGGSFEQVNGQNRMNAAAADATTGALTSWNPTVGNTWNEPEKMLVHNNTVYMVGLFIDIGGQNRNRIGAVDKITGAVSSWDPNTTGAVFDIDIEGDVLYAAGEYYAIAGQARTHLASFDLTTQNLTSWAPVVNEKIFAMDVNDNTCFIAGRFTSVNNTVRKQLAAINLTSGNVESWTNELSEQYGFASLTADGDHVFLAGSFTMVGMVTRNNIAAINLTTGEATAFNPNADSTVKALCLDGNRLYTGGAFSNIGGQNRTYFAALETSSGAAIASNINPNGEVLTIEKVTPSIGNPSIFIGGAFTLVNNTLKRYIAHMDANTLALITNVSWLLDDIVKKITFHNNKIYVAGNFLTMSGFGTTKPYLLVIDANNNNITNFTINLQSNTVGNNVSAIYDFLIDGNIIYIAGKFQDLNYTLKNLAAVDINTGAILPWTPITNINNAVYSIAKQNDQLYLGGAFGYINGLSMYGLAVVDIPSALAYKPDYVPNSYIHDLHVEGKKIYAGGEFTNFEYLNGADYYGRTSFAVFNVCYPSHDTVQVNACGEDYVFNGQTYSTNGLYLQSYTNVDGCDSTITLDLSLAPTPNTFIYEEDGYLNASYNSNYIYQWLNCDNNTPIAGANDSYFFPTTSGNYAVQIDLNGCVDTSDCLPVIMQGLNAAPNLGISLFPNPTQDKVFITLTAAETSEISVYDLLGKQLAVYVNASAQKIELDLPEQTGIYFVEVKTPQGQQAFKVVKQ